MKRIMVVVVLLFVGCVAVGPRFKHQRPRVINCGTRRCDGVPKP